MKKKNEYSEQKEKIKKTKKYINNCRYLYTNLTIFSICKISKKKKQKIQIKNYIHFINRSTWNNHKIDAHKTHSFQQFHTDWIPRRNSLFSLIYTGYHSTLIWYFCLLLLLLLLHHHHGGHCCFFLIYFFSTLKKTLKNI